MDMIILIGASASGKTEIAKALSRTYGITKMTTHTTRAMRVGEREDIDYHFVDKETFLRMKEEDQFVETTFYNGNYYGSSKAEIGLDKCVVLDPEGLKSFIALGEKSIVTFFLLCSRETRKARMEGRGDDPESVAKRLEGDEKTFDPDNVVKCDYYIDSNTRSVENLTEEIVTLYRKRLSEI